MLRIPPFESIKKSEKGGILSDIVGFISSISFVCSGLIFFCEVHRYFTCKPGHGAFIRPSKAHLGWTLAECWADRYDDESLAFYQAEQLRIMEETDYKYRFVGFDHIAKGRSVNEALFMISCHCEPTRSIDDAKILTTMFPKVWDASITMTLLQSWETVHNLDGIKYLSKLDLSFNLIKYSTLDPEPFRGAFQNLENLKLQGIDQAWSVVVRLARVGCFTQLQELDLKYSKLTSLEVDGELVTAEEAAKLFPNLKTIELGGNDIARWSDFLTFKDLPKLESLSLYRNPAKGFMITEGFEKLESLYISNTETESWEQIRSLTKLPSLTHVQIVDTPFYLAAGSWQVNGCILISILPNVEYLNQQERRSFTDVNIAAVYWKYIGTLLEARYDKKVPWDDLDLEEMERDYPGFKKCLEEFGIEKKKKKKKGMQLISVTFVSHDPETCMVPSKTLKLPPKTKVATLKLLCKKQFKVPTKDQTLTISVEKNAIPTPMLEEQRPLSWYAISEEVEVRMIRTA